MQAIKFIATFADIQGAIKFNRDGMRITLDIPETETTEVVKLLALRDVVLDVSINIEQPKETGKNGDKRRKGQVCKGEY